MWEVRSGLLSLGMLAQDPAASQHVQPDYLHMALFIWTNKVLTKRHDRTLSQHWHMSARQGRLEQIRNSNDGHDLNWAGKQQLGVGGCHSASQVKEEGGRYHSVRRVGKEGGGGRYHSVSQVGEGWGYRSVSQVGWTSATTL